MKAAAMSPFHAAVAVVDSSAVGQARRLATQVADEAGLDETQRGKVAIVATELANNLAQHARDGELLLNAGVVRGRGCVDVLAVDRGPGVPDVGRCLQDGYSTAGTAGTGLGAVRRLAARFDMYSRPPEGTIVFARIMGNNRSDADGGRFEWGVVCRPAPHEMECGDIWRTAEQAERLVFMVVDGLGHGPRAAEAARAAGAVFDRDPFTSPRALLDEADVGLRSTRGAAVAAASIDLTTGMLSYAGIGNIAGVLYGRSKDGSRRGLVSHNGIVGQKMRTVQEFDFACGGPNLLLMHSDGLQSRWSLDAYPGLEQRHPGVIAGVLYRDFRRDRDDVTVGVVRIHARERRDE
ncbi:MAG TPA: ATP-binding protein/SpoIIE family protein phosphatase [Phycisphaerae bacterium]|nr:ATP-binding protein/SpoIIE family protein phosphatase [Phycisphaerae bacterium]